MTLKWCEHMGGLGPPFSMCDICEPKPELSLLVIDLGDSCVVKAERFPASTVGRCWWFGVGGADHDAHQFQFKINGDNVHLVPYRIAELRAAIDALEDKPVPRIERTQNTDEDGTPYVLINGMNERLYLTHADLH